MPNPAAAAATTVTSAFLSGTDSDAFRVSACLAALGVCDGSGRVAVGNIAGLITTWSGCAEHKDAVTVLLGIPANDTVRRTLALSQRDLIVRALRAALCGLSTEQQATVRASSAQLAGTGLPVVGVHFGGWLAQLAAPAPPPQHMPPPHGAAPSAQQLACEAEVERRLAANCWQCR